MKKVLMFLFFAVVAVFGLVKTASAESYPIPELGNCASQQECFYYCEIPANQPACWSYGYFVKSGHVLGDATTSATLQSKEDYMKQHGVTFPIPELGNCASVSECSAFCSQDANKTACQGFAKAHALTGPRPPAVDPQTLLAKAKEALGCDSLESCKAFCDSPDNKQKCIDFSKSVGIPTPTPRESFNTGLFDAAKNELGCDSLLTCKDFCSKEENFQKCQDFAKEHNLASSRPKTDEQNPNATPSSQTGAPQLPCKTLEECSTFCRDHKDVCVQNNDKLRQLKGGSSSNFLPGGTLNSTNGGSGSVPSTNLANGLYGKLHDSTGCSSDVDCYKYCITHYNACPGFPYQYYYFPTAYPTNYSNQQVTPTTCPLRPNYPGCTWILGSNCNDAKLTCQTTPPQPPTPTPFNTGTSNTSGQTSPIPQISQ